jgi:hypothetical protein
MSALLEARFWWVPVLRSDPIRSSKRNQNGAPSTAAPTEISRPRTFSGQLVPIASHVAWDADAVHGVHARSSANVPRYVGCFASQLR